MQNCIYMLKILSNNMGRTKIKNVYLFENVQKFPKIIPEQ